MQLSEQILNDCEELFILIQSEEVEAKMDYAIQSLQSLIESQVDGWTHYSDEMYARTVQHRLMEIWSLISSEAKIRAPELREQYDKIVQNLEGVSGYETDFDEDDIA